MINELVNFVNNLPSEVFSYNLKLKDGLYWIVGRGGQGSLHIVEKRNYKEGDEQDELLDWCLQVLKFLPPVSPAKIFNPNKKIFGGSCSAFALGFNKKNLINKEKEPRYSEETVKEEMQQYFKSADAYLESDIHKNWKKEFETFCIQNLVQLLKEDETFQKPRADLDIYVIFNEPTLSDFKEIHDRYVSRKVFNKDEYNIVIGSTTYGISDSMSSFDDKKIFRQHKTAPFDLNYRVTGDTAKIIWQFHQLRRRQVLPNPLPIFIDKQELNGKMIAVVNEDKTVSYSQMLRKLFEDTPKGDLGSYYLLFFLKGSIADLDFVPSFRYHLENMQITEVFPLGGKIAGKIDNVFEFERKVANKVFDKQLIVESKNWLKYFDDIKYDHKHMSYNTYNQLLRYRKGFYDYIYKSKREAIQQHAFHDIMKRGILDFIRRDTGKDSPNDYDYAIKEKLNIWFSLYDYFNPSPSNKFDMINKTQTLVARMQEIVKEGSAETFQSDDEYAFAAGQLIRFLLSKNESANRSHALLEPFLQKTEPELFKLAIARSFDTYKHALKFYGGSKRYEFDKLMSIVMGYEPKSGTNMKDHLPLILAGYFAETVFKKNTFIETEQEITNT